MKNDLILISPSAAEVDRKHRVKSIGAALANFDEPLHGVLASE